MKETTLNTRMIFTLNEQIRIPLKRRQELARKVLSKQMCELIETQIDTSLIEIASEQLTNGEQSFTMSFKIIEKEEYFRLKRLEGIALKLMNPNDEQYEMNMHFKNTGSNLEEWVEQQNELLTREFLKAIGTATKKAFEHGKYFFDNAGNNLDDIESLIKWAESEVEL